MSRSTKRASHIHSVFGECLEKQTAAERSEGDTALLKRLLDVFQKRVSELEQMTRRLSPNGSRYALFPTDEEYSFETRQDLEFPVVIRHESREVKVPDFIEFKHKLAAVTLAEMLNYDQAAKRLGITPSELKRQIETLEAGLSLSIFKVVQDVPH